MSYFSGHYGNSN